MENIRKVVLRDIGDDARRQYIDAQSAFTEWERAVKAAAEVRGGMYWKRQGTAEYLIRTSPANTQKSLGRKSPETEAIFNKFTNRKETAEQRVKDLAEELTRHQRMNRALYVGRAPQMMVDVLRELAKADISEYFTLVGTHAIYAYEAAAGVRIEPSDALATQDIDLLWDTRKHMIFSTQMKVSGTSMLGVLKRIDPTFEIRPDQQYTAVNSKGFEVDIIRRMATKEDPHPIRITEDEDDFWVAQAERAGVLVNAPRFTSVVVSPSGYMARVTTISPVVFVEFKRWMSQQPDRAALKRTRDALQADIVEELVEEYLPHLKERHGHKEKMGIRI